MEDVAARAGVSRALVSIVFRDLPGASPDNRERVRRAATEIGFRPDRRASLLGRKRTNLIGVAFGVGHEFHAELVSALYEAAAERQLEVVLSGVTAHRTERQAVAELLAFRCDALLLLAPTSSARELTALAAEGPVVVLARSVRAAGVDVVRTDDEQGARLATEHLLGLGHRALVHLDGGRAAGAAERRRGFAAALHRAGLSEPGHRRPGGLTEEDGSRAARSFLAEWWNGHHPMSARRDPARPDPVRSDPARSDPARSDPARPDPVRSDLAPTGVLAFNDQCAIGFLATLREACVRVPDDVSLVGYDDSRLAHASWTRLTTIRQDAATLAARAVDRVLAHLAGDHRSGRRAATEVLVAPSLVIRSTTASPGAETRAVGHNPSGWGEVRAE